MLLRQKGHFHLYIMPRLQIYHLTYLAFLHYIPEKKLKIAEDTALNKHTFTPILKDIK